MSLFKRRPVKQVFCITLTLEQPVEESNLKAVLEVVRPLARVVDVEATTTYGAIDETQEAEVRVAIGGKIPAHKDPGE